MNQDEFKQFMSESGLHNQYVPLNEIHADDDFNCRGKIIPMDVKDLAKDMDRQGLLQPILVMPYPLNRQAETGKKFLLVAGYRRFTAAKINEWKVIECKVLPATISETDARFINLNENLQRQDLDFMQEAEAIAKIMGGLNVTEQQVMDRLGQSRGWVQVRMMALKMPKEVQLEIRAGYINQTDLRDLYSIKYKEGDEALAEAVRKLKDDQLLGRKKKGVVGKKQKGNTKRNRKRPEIFEVQELVQSMFGNGLHTRLLAWCAGEISNLDLNETLKLEAERRGVPFRSMEIS